MSGGDLMSGEVQALEAAIRAMPLPENVMLLEADQAWELESADLLKMPRGCGWKIVLCEVPAEKDEPRPLTPPEYAVIQVGIWDRTAAVTAGTATTTLEEAIVREIVREAEALSARIVAKRAVS